MTRLSILAFMAALAAMGPALAQAPPGPPPAPPAAAPDPAFEAARAAFEGLPEAERKAVQDALVWTGDHTGVVSGQFGRRTYEALLAYQKRARLPASGALDERGRAGLQAAARRAREAAGFETVSDPRTGARLGIPAKIFPKTGVATGQGAGSRWQTADERATLDTRVFPPGQADLPALFERLTAPNPNNPSRKVTYKLLRPDYLVVTGETDTGRFYTRYAAGPAGVRGYNLGYDKALAKDLEILVVAIANAFEPFPGAAPTPDPVPPRVAAPLTGPAPAALPSATGLVVGPRRVLTAAIEACPQPRIGSAPARIVSIDKGAGLMLLEADAGRAVPLAPGALPEAGGLVALAYAPGKPGRALVAVAGERGPAGILAPLQPGAAGAPVFDRTGRLVGLVRGMPTDLRLVAGVAIPAGYALAGGEALAAALKGAGGPVAPASTGERSAGEIATAMAAAIVPVECGR